MIKKILIGLSLFLVASIFGVIYIKSLLLPVSNETTEIDFLIPKGSSVSLIGRNLEKERLIKSALAFKFLVQVSNSQNKIQAGEFQLPKNLALPQIVEKLKKGPTELWVTIPEGLRREEVVIKFATALNKDEDFIAEFLSLTNDKEGYLFPDTYLFPKAATTAQIVTKLTSTFNKRVVDVTREQLIMASMLERETFSDSEKPIVAGILYKRIKNGWPLQVDATLQYAKDSAKFKTVTTANKYWEPIFSLDKELNSLFNTYKHLGLPPSPIASPGLVSINASIAPEESDYWYYIHDNDGKIHFSRTLEEHNSNIQKYLN
jgi:UPF0755 protein